MAELSNPEGDVYISALLNAVVEAARSEGHEASVEREAPTTGAKDSVVVDIVVGLSTTATWELLRAASRRLRRHPERRSQITVVVDGETVTVEQIDED